MQVTWHNQSRPIDRDEEATWHHRGRLIARVILAVDLHLRLMDTWLNRVHQIVSNLDR